MQFQKQHDVGDFVIITIKNRQQNYINIEIKKHTDAILNHDIKSYDLEPYRHVYCKCILALRRRYFCLLLCRSLRLYPHGNGQDQASKGFVSVYLRLVSCREEDVDVRAEYKFYIISAYGGEENARG